MRPTTEAELAEAITSAAGPLSVRGGGTRVVPAPGEVLETTGLTGVTLYEPAALTIVVRAGTPLAEVEALLATERQILAFEPPDPRVLTGRTGQPTVGGMVATNASGPRAVLSGDCRDFLIGARFVDGAGRLVKSGGRVMKNVTGYDLARLMCGAGGAFGVLTEVAFKVLPAPEASATLVLECDAGAALAVMSAALATPWEVSGASWVAGRLYLRIEGFAEQIAYRSERLRAHLARFGSFDVASDFDWTDLRDTRPLATADGALWRIDTRPSMATDLVGKLPTESLQIDQGGAVLMLRAAPDLDVAKLIGALGKAKCLTGETEDAPSVSLVEQQLITGLKAKFDPNMVLNGGASHGSL